MSLRTKYFILAIVGIGSIGIWWPVIIEYIELGSVKTAGIVPNIYTYYVAILFTGCIDFFMSLLKQEDTSFNGSSFLNAIAILLLTFASVVLGTFFHLKKYYVLSTIISLIGVGLSWTMWWVANINNINLEDSIDPKNATPTIETSTNESKYKV